MVYDIEDFLLTAGSDLRRKDIRGRIPLHYCFVKIGQPLGKSHLDPIELVMILLNSVKGTNVPEFVKTVDSFGASSLHYASMRGATICCTYFTSEMKGTFNVDLKDMRSNTPFGLAVWCGHEGSSLHFQQLGANFLQILDTNVELVQLPDLDFDAGNDKVSQKSNNEGSNEDSDADSNNGSDSESSDNDDDSDKDDSGRNVEKKLKKLQAAAAQEASGWIWSHKVVQEAENRKMQLEAMRYPIFQEVVKKEWQGNNQFLSEFMFAVTIVLN